MPKQFWLDFIASEIAVRVLTSQRYDKKLTPEIIVDDYELSSEDRKYVLEKSHKYVKERMKNGS